MRYNNIKISNCNLKCVNIILTKNKKLIQKLFYNKQKSYNLITDLIQI